MVVIVALAWGPVRAADRPSWAILALLLLGWLLIWFLAPLAVPGHRRSGEPLVPRSPDARRALRPLALPASPAALILRLRRRWASWRRLGHSVPPEVGPSGSGPRLRTEPGQI